MNEINDALRDSEQPLRDVEFEDVPLRWEPEAADVLSHLGLSEMAPGRDLYEALVAAVVRGELHGGGLDAVIAAGYLNHDVDRGAVDALVEKVTCGLRGFPFEPTGVYVMTKELALSLRRLRKGKPELIGAYEYRMFVRNAARRAELPAREIGMARAARILHPDDLV